MPVKHELIQFMPISFLHDGKPVSVQLQGEPWCIDSFTTYPATVEFSGISKSTPIFVSFRSDVQVPFDETSVVLPVDKVLLACLTDRKFTSKKISSSKIRGLLQNLVVSKIKELVIKLCTTNTEDVKQRHEVIL